MWMWWTERWVSRRPEVEPEETPEVVWGKGEPAGEKRDRLWKLSWMAEGRVWYQWRRE